MTDNIAQATLLTTAPMLYQAGEISPYPMVSGVDIENIDVSKLEGLPVIIDHLDHFTELDVIGHLKDVKINGDSLLSNIAFKDNYKKDDFLGREVSLSYTFEADNPTNTQTVKKPIHLAIVEKGRCVDGECIIEEIMEEEKKDDDKKAENESPDVAMNEDGESDESVEPTLKDIMTMLSQILEKMSASGTAENEASDDKKDDEKEDKVAKNAAPTQSVDWCSLSKKMDFLGESVDPDDFGGNKLAAVKAGVARYLKKNPSHNPIYNAVAKNAAPTPTLLDMKRSVDVLVEMKRKDAEDGKKERVASNSVTNFDHHSLQERVNAKNKKYYEDLNKRSI